MGCSVGEGKVKRRWAYILQPKDFEIGGCKCGNNECQWSEYAKHLWCAKCKVDFVPEHGGIFDGPIPVQASALMGIVFHRYNLRSKRLVEYPSKEWHKTWP